MNLPKDLTPVLARINCNDAWKSYTGSDTFDNGETVLAWKYVEDCFKD